MLKKYIIPRFHSFYPWHRGGDYRNFMNEEDKKMLRVVKEFRFDVYKSTTLYFYNQ